MLRLVAMVGGVLLLAACATLNQGAGGLQQQAADYAYVSAAENSWELHAKISYRDGRRLATGQIKWRQLRAGHYDLRLFSPQGEFARLEQNADGNKLRVRNREITDARDLSRVLGEELDLHIPVKQLSWWILGQPYPNSSFQAKYADGTEARNAESGEENGAGAGREEDGASGAEQDQAEDAGKLILELQQDDWQVSYSDFEKGLARRIRAEAPPYSILLVITSWQRTSPAAG